jgi:hypothetical protein
MERTQSELNKLEQQRRTFEQWQTSPKTREMEYLRDYLSTPEAQTRRHEIKAQQARAPTPTETLTGAGTGIKPVEYSPIQKNLVD